MPRSGILLCAIAAALAIAACGRTKAIVGAAPDASLDRGAAGADRGVDGLSPVTEAGTPDIATVFDSGEDVDGDVASVDADASGAADRGAADGAADRGGDVADRADALAPAFSCLTGAIPCDPYACDVTTGRCKAACSGPADCAPGIPCSSDGRCASQPSGVCNASVECATGFCADGVCCASACTGRCMSCRVPGAIGVCTPVPAAAADPHKICSPAQSCDGRGACVPKVCAVDFDCGRFHRCRSGQCVTCDATCASSADCIAGAICVDGNGCTFCRLPDAGAG